MKRTLALSIASAVFISVFALAAVAGEHPTGLERASQATLQGLEKSQGNSANAPGQVNKAGGLKNQDGKLTGRERAAAAIAAAMDRGNGNGNGFGRGNAVYIHEILAAGQIPGQLDDTNHGTSVREMVHAFNELRRSQGE